MNSVCRPKYKKGLDDRFSAWACHIFSSCSGCSAARRCLSHPVARKLVIAPNSSRPPHTRYSRDPELLHRPTVMPTKRNGFEPAAESRLLEFQASDLPIAPVQDACPQAQECADQCVPITATSKEGAGSKADSKMKIVTIFAVTGNLMSCRLMGMEILRFSRA